MLPCRPWYSRAMDHRAGGTLQSLNQLQLFIFPHDMEGKGGKAEERMSKFSTQDHRSYFLKHLFSFPSPYLGMRQKIFWGGGKYKSQIEIGGTP